MRLLLVTAILASGLLGACRKPHRPPAPVPAVVNTMAPGEFITTPGNTSYTANGGTDILQISKRPDHIRWELGFRNNSTSRTRPGSPIPVKSHSQAWFVYMEDSRSYWAFNGTDYLAFATAGGDGVSVRDGKLEQGQPVPPEEVRLRLPAEIQKLFPKAEPPVKRPSI